MIYCIILYKLVTCILYNTILNMITLVFVLIMHGIFTPYRRCMYKINYIYTMFRVYKYLYSLVSAVLTNLMVFFFLLWFATSFCFPLKK